MLFSTLGLSHVTIDSLTGRTVYLNEKDRLIS